VEQDNQSDHDTAQAVDVEVALTHPGRQWHQFGLSGMNFGRHIAARQSGDSFKRLDGTCPEISSRIIVPLPLRKQSP